MDLYRTNNPLGSNDPRDLSDNSVNFDQGMGGTEDTFLDRFGRPRYTWNLFEKMTQNALDQIQGTVSSAQEQVTDIADGAKASMLKTAEELGDDLNNKRYASYTAMNADPQTREAVVAVVDGDPNANLNGWYVWNNTTKKWVRFTDQPAMSSVLLSKVPTLQGASASMLPLIYNEKNQVVLWLENGRVNGAGLSSTVAMSIQKIIKSADFNPAMLPLIINQAGQVVAWLKGGRFNAAGLDLTINELIQAALSTYRAPPYKNSDGSKIWAFKAKIANALGGTGSARVVGTGDSWFHHLAETAQPLSQSLYASYGQAGTGWISVYADENGPTSNVSQLLNGARLIKSDGWTVLDMVPGQSDALDGHAASATGTAATIDITGLKTQSLTWYYLDGSMSFRYSVDGGTPVVVNGGGTGTRKSLEISGLTDTVHTIRFDLVGNTGTVVMYGGMALRTTPGVEFSKAGNGGSTSTQWAALAPVVQAYASELKPDLALIILGTNDLNQGISKASFKASLQVLVNAYRAGSPNCGVILITPTRGQSTLDLGLMAQYAEAMSEISQATAGVEFIDLNSFMPPRITTDAYGLWKDALHLSEAGGRFVTGLLMKYFLKVN